MKNFLFKTLLLISIFATATAGSENNNLSATAGITQQEINTGWTFKQARGISISDAY
jgi:hypothetical protein